MCRFRYLTQAPSGAGPRGHGSGVKDGSRACSVLEFPRLGTHRGKSQVPFRGKRTFHQALLRVSLTLPGLGSCSRTKVLTAADYSNKSRSFGGGSPRGQECRRAFLRAHGDLRARPDGQLHPPPPQLSFISSG